MCSAFVAALTEYGVPDHVLTDNGTQFTGRHMRPRPIEVLFDRICCNNGIEHLLIKIRSPTTTGKAERWHQSIQTEFLDEHGPFESLTTAQSAIDAWRSEYNTERPHESRDMDTPATHFASIPPCERETLELWRPPELSLAPAETDPVTGEDLDAEPGPIPELPPTAPEPDPATPTPDAVEREAECRQAETWASPARWRPGLALVELSAVEQRHRAVLAVERGEPQKVVAAHAVSG